MNKKEISKEQKQLLLQAAKQAVNQAYAPYSKFYVGAAVLTENGNIFSGCNVENASYGLTICAEQAAICNAVIAESGKNCKIRAIAVVNAQNQPCSPCGACRQFILEFGPEAIVLFESGTGLVARTVADLLPGGFQLNPATSS